MLGIEIVMLSLEGIFFALAILLFYYSFLLASFLKGPRVNIFTAAGAFLFIIAAIFGIADVFIFGFEYYISIIGFYGFFVWIISLSLLLAGWFCFVRIIRTVHGKFLFKMVFRFPHGKYYLMGLMLLTLLGTPAYIADIAIKGFDWISIFTIGVWILAFASLTIGERRLCHSTKKALKVRGAKREGLILVRDEIHLVMANTDLANRFLYIMKPSIGITSINEAFEKAIKKYPVLSRGCRITKNGLLSTKPILKSLEKIPENERIPRIVGMFSGLYSDLIRLYSAVTSPGHAKVIVEENYRTISRQYEFLSSLPQILKGMPKGILELEKLKLLSKDDLEKKVKERTRELEKAVSELKKLDVRKNEFISMISHELRTPLTNIQSFSQILQEKDIISDTKLRDRYLKIIDNETERFAELITNILDLSKIDLGIFNLDMKEEKIPPIIEYVETTMGISMKKAGLKTKYTVEKGLPEIKTDRRRLIQILINLLTNAINFTPSGGITLDVRRQGSSVHFSVADTGIGIAKKDFKTVFERFRQVESKQKRKAGGSGLGLALCKEFVEAMGGKIWLESAPGKGTTFHFTLPLKAPKGRKLIKAGV